MSTSKLPNIKLSFFAVRNGAGEFFRRKGYGGYGDSWVPKIEQARIYTKIGHARSIVTFFSANKGYEVPEIIEFEARPVRVVDENARVKKRASTKADRRRKLEIKKAEEDLAHAQRNLARARGNSPRSTTTGSGTKFTNRPGE